MVKVLQLGKTMSNSFLPFTIKNHCERKDPSLPLSILIIHTGESDLQQQCLQSGKARRAICKENGNPSSLLTTVSLCRYSSSGFVFKSLRETHVFHHLCFVGFIKYFLVFLILLISPVSRGLCFIHL